MKELPNKPDPIDQVHQLLRPVSDEQRAEVWEGVAANLAKHPHEDNA